MELRTLRYFLTVLQEGSITNAAKHLHITQPTLSRQLSELEDELGRQLFVRSHQGIIPTEHGAVLAGYAADILGLADKAVEAVSMPEKTLQGSVHIAVGETKELGLLADAMNDVRREYPNIDFQLYSGNSTDLMGGLARGQYDFMFECELQPHVNLNTLKVPGGDRWGVVVPEGHPLSEKESVTIDDLVAYPLITSQQGCSLEPMRSWLGERVKDIDVAATYSLPLNSKFLVRKGVGIVLVYEGLVEGDGLVFVPLEPGITSHHGLLWRKTMPTRQAQVFLDAVQSRLEQE